MCKTLETTPKGHKKQNIFKMYKEVISFVKKVGPLVFLFICFIQIIVLLQSSKKGGKKKHRETY